jgi:hypothetical protein
MILPFYFPFDRIDILRGDVVVLRIDLNLTAFDEDISACRTIFPAFFSRSV